MSDSPNEQLLAAARRLAATYYGGSDPRDVELAESIAKLDGFNGTTFNFAIDETLIQVAVRQVGI